MEEEPARQLCEADEPQHTMSMIRNALKEIVAHRAESGPSRGPPPSQPNSACVAGFPESRDKQALLQSEWRTTTEHSRDQGDRQWPACSWCSSGVPHLSSSSRSSSRAVGGAPRRIHSSATRAAEVVSSRERDTFEEVCGGACKQRADDATRAVVERNRVAVAPAPSSRGPEPSGTVEASRRARQSLPE